MKRQTTYRTIQIDGFTYTMILMSFILFTIIDRNLLGVSAGSALLIYIVSAIGIVFMLAWFFKNGLYYDNNIKILLLMVVYLLFLLSYSYLTTDLEGFTSLIRLCTYILVLYLFSHIKLNRINQTILLMLFSSIVVFNFINVLYTLQFNRNTGVFDNPNTLAYMSFILLFFILLGLKISNNKIAYLYFTLILILNLIVIYSSTSRAVWMSVVVSFIVVYLYTRFKISLIVHKVIFLILMTAVFIFSYIYPLLYGTNTGYTLNYYFIKFTGKGLFSGREKIFQNLIELIEQKPLLGYGVSEIPTKYLYIGQGAHNTFMSILFQTGIIGLVIYIVLLYGIWTSLYNKKSNKINSIFIAFFSSLILYQGLELAFVQGPFSIRIFEWMLIGLGLNYVNNTNVLKNQESYLNYEK